MGPEVAGPVLPEDLRAPLARSVRLLPGLVTSDGGESRAALAEAEILVSGWGCPRLTTDLLARAPRLRAVIHAAGTVKSLVSDALWERGIVVSSAADANAGPVMAYTLAVVTLGMRRALTTAGVTW